jgi:hypothetical protein
MKHVRKGLLFVIAVGSLGAIAGLAVAAGLDTEEDTTPIAGSGPAKATAECKGDREAVSGGWFVDNPDFTTIKSSRPAGKARWTSTAFELSAGVKGEAVIAYAYCRDQAVSTKQETVTTPDPMSARRGITVPRVNAKATCPGDKVAVSGGFATADEEDIYPFASRRAGKRAWKVTASSFDSGSSLTAYVRCANGKALDVAKKVATVGDGRSKLTARCGAGERVVSGGFKSSGSLSKGGPFFDGSRKAGNRRWQAFVATFVSPRVTVFAYCEEK